MADDLAFFGVDADEAVVAEDEALPLFPENVSTVRAFLAMGTQWLVGMAGATGLNYVAIEPVLRLQRVKPRRWPEIFDGLQVMEEAVLAVWAEHRERENRK